MADDVSIVVRVRDATRSGITAVNDSLNRLTRNANQMDRSFGSAVGAAISLAPALIPLAAATMPIAASMAAAGVAVGAFGAAVVPQVMAMNEAAEAEKKYTDAVEEHGATSKEAVQAEKAYLAAVQKLPPATRTAAAGLSVLKDEYKEWSNSLAGDTMPVVTKGMAVFGSLFPKLTPMVKGASEQLNRFMTIVAGGIQSKGFDKFMASFSTFATGALAKANDGLIRLMRTMDTGKVSGGLSEFMQYARENGPLVGDVLKNVAKALTHLLVAASDVGVGMLTLINVFANLVASLPTELVTTLLQVAIAFKAVKMASAGFAAVSVGIHAITAQVIAMRSAAGAATGRVAALTAAFGAMSRTAKLATAATGIGLLVVGLMQLTQIGRSTAPNVDRLTTSLGKLAQTGKVTGEAAKAFGADLSGLSDSLRVLARPDLGQGIDRWISNLIKIDTPEISDAKKDLDAVDKSLANLVKNGNADLAAAAFDYLAAGMATNGLSSKELSNELGDYRSAQEDAAFETKLAADAMGVFGAQAIAVQTKLDAQRQSTDGLAQSINALSTATLTARGDMRSFEAAIDAAEEAAKKNGKTLDINTDKGRLNGAALDAIAASTIKVAESARANGAAWSTVNGIYDRGYDAMVKSAMAMGQTESAARKLASQILKTPNKTAILRGNMEDLQAKLNRAKAQLKKVPDSRKAQVRAEIASLTASIRRAQNQLASLRDRTVSVGVRFYKFGDLSLSAASAGRMATGGVVGAAGGGPRSRMTLVGEQGPELVDLAPGSRVHSNPDSRRMAAGWGGGGGGPIELVINLDGREVARQLWDPMRAEVWARSGGDVQRALGRG